MKVFLSYAFGEQDAPIAARLRAVAAAYDIIILLPDRTYPSFDGLLADAQKKIRQSDAVIALITRTAHEASINLVNEELRIAAQASKPIITLIEQGVPIQGVPSQVVYNRLDPSAHETSLMKVLGEIRRQQQQKDLTALGWIAGIALGLVALSEMLGDEK